VDFLPTLLGLCGLPAMRRAEGVDYAPLLRGKPDAPRRRHLIMQLADWACIREGDSKLTMDLEGTRVRSLYRLGDDPLEQQNRIADPAEREAIDRLRAAYREWLRDVRTRVGNPAEAAAPSPPT
jgi:arylsulfatase A-like enzyme